MERFWLKNYPKGMPADIIIDPKVSIVDMFNRAVKKFGDRPAVSNFGTEITYQELDHLSDYFAAYLQQELGLKKGDRFAIMMPNLIQYLVALHAALKIGMVVVNVNPMYTPGEIEHQVNDAGVDAILVLELFAHTVEQALPKLKTLKHIIVTAIGDSFPTIKRFMANFVMRRIKKMKPNYNLPTAIHYLDMINKGKQLKLERIEINGDDLAFLQYTGGTTGVAKGAMLTHSNIVSNVDQAYHWSGHFLRAGKEIVITALPLYHIFCLLANALLFMRMGGMNVLITNPRDIDGFVKEMSRYKFTAITSVNTLFNALVHNKKFQQLDFSKLHFAMGGGMAVQHAVAVGWQKITGVHILEAYGLTETSPAATINPVYCREYNGSIGLPIPSTEVKIIDDDGGELPIGKEGELCIRGPQVMRGYWNMPEETKKVLTEDGWLKTGDVAKFDEEGFLYIVDRKKDMVVVSGFNVYPNEVEAVIAEHPGVNEVAVIGVPHPVTGEAVKAFIVPVDGEKLASQELITFCRKKLTPYKVPKIFEFRDELPKSNVGKILRRALRDEARGESK